MHRIRGKLNWDLIALDFAKVVIVFSIMWIFAALVRAIYIDW